MVADLHVPTAPGRRPLIGHALPVLGDRLSFLQEARSHGPIVRIDVGPKTLFVVNSPGLIQELLVGSKSRDMKKGLLFEKLKLLGGVALPMADGEQHLQRRRLMQPAFHRAKVHEYVETMRDAAQTAIGGWSDGATLDIKAETRLIAQGVIMSVTLSSDPEVAEARLILDSVDTIFKAALQRALFPMAVLERLPTRRNRQVRHAARILRTAVGKIVREHRVDPDAYDDVVSLLLAAHDESGAPLPDDEILSEITGLMAAGGETTAVVLAWLFHELGRNPDLERRLHDEVDAALAGNPPTAEHFPQLSFTRRLVQETLRLYCPPWIITRQTTAPMRLGNFSLPAGANLIYSPYTLHRDPDLYPDPLRFDPDRWLEGRPQPPKGAYIPFGAGKRQCLGDAFAWTEATVVVALIASRWRLRPSPRDEVRPVGEITVHPSALRMTTEARRVPSRAAT